MALGTGVFLVVIQNPGPQELPPHSTCPCGYHPEIWRDGEWPSRSGLWEVLLPSFLPSFLCWREFIRLSEKQSRTTPGWNLSGKSCSFSPPSSCREILTYEINDKGRSQCHRATWGVCGNDRPCLQPLPLCLDDKEEGQRQ